MARFKNQVSKGIEQEPGTKNQFLERENQKLETRNQDTENSSKENDDALATYTADDLEPVNAAGFKVPYVVREHWKMECRKKRMKLSPMLKAYLASELGLPPGFTLEDL